MATRSILVTDLSRKTPTFGDETNSRRRFEVRNALFWRRGQFSSSFLDGKLHFLATRSILVTVLSRKTPTFGDETNSRRRFEVENALFWRRE
ncbi:hypothetical protein [Caldibacillus thermoamylovorans]|uniref:hypothetical protein n=1 Tax=Caldibacillus thermoamylovorans TaxID=35841 RepID=UPI00203A8DDF|nr:hypothetical protein [Caldibacillus thermoamylovorans]MCM3053961.1 hypothetical protein [Caldibacillus thermoamylovorans]